MHGAQPRLAAETDVVRRLEAEWRAIADSPWLRRRLRVWSAEDPRLAFEEGHRLVAAAQRRDTQHRTEGDRVLTALLERFEGDPLARRVALQVVLPGVKSLIDSLPGRDVEERAARVMATAVEILAHCAAVPTGTPPSLRVFADIRRGAMRAAIGDRSERAILLGDFDRFADPSQSQAFEECEQRPLAELVECVRRRGHLGEEAARLVVLTRTGVVSVNELAAAAHVNPQSMRRQRLRAEQQLRRNLSHHSSPRVGSRSGSGSAA